jgi:elongation factor P
MLTYNEVTPKKYIIYDDAPYEVLASHVFRKQQRKPVNQTKLRNLITGNVVEATFQVSDKIEEADIEKRPVKFLYKDARKGEFWFHPEGKPAERFTLAEDIIGNQERWMKSNERIDSLVFSYNDEENIIGITLPPKVDLEVTEAAPAVKGNTAQGATKTVILETGTEINVPLFINEGDILRISTQTGEYAERVEKS